MPRELVFMQCSDQLITPSDEMRRYYSAAYSRMPGYVLPEHYFEIPFWIPLCAGLLPASEYTHELHVVEDLDRSVAFMRSRPQATFLFSVLEANVDGEVHYAELVAKEVAVHILLHDSGIPAPAVVDYDTTRQDVPWSWMLVEHVVHDDAATLDDAQQRRLGELAAAIHAVGVPGAGSGVIPSPADWTAFVRDRLLRRLDKLDAYASLPGDRDRWTALVARYAGTLPAGERRLLHMDLRASNLCLRDGEVVAVLDMTNAMFGSPLLELGRLQTYGLLTPAFLDGYDSVAPGFARPCDQVAFYALDSASMLALLAREELADEAMFADKLRFTEHTLELLLAAG